MHWWTGGAGEDRLRGNTSFDPWNLIQVMLAKESHLLFHFLVFYFLVSHPPF
jgi:hypothetical protein